MELIKKKTKNKTVKGKKDTNGCQFQRDNHSKGFTTCLNICLPMKNICLNGIYNPFVNK